MITLDAGVGEGLVLEEDGDLIEQRSALHDVAHRYRFGITRCWAPALEQLVVIMLNPSLAGAFAGDPTTTRVRTFASRDGRFGGYVGLNVFAAQSPKPKALRGLDDPVGWANDAVIAAVLKQAAGGSALLGWGASDLGRKLTPLFEARTEQLVAALREHEITPLCLGVTKAGRPRHPLYVLSEQPLVDFETLTNGRA